MKLLIDACVAASAVDDLVSAGHETERVGDWAEDPGDVAILTLANDRHQIVVTLDKDFGELAVVHGIPHCGIVRLVDIRAPEQGRAAAAALAAYGGILSAGGIVTVERGRIRIRPIDSPQR